MKFSNKDIFSKCDQIHRKLRIWSHLLKKSLTENYIFCVVISFCYLKNNTSSRYDILNGNKKNNPEVPTIVFYTTRKTTRLYKESDPISDWVFRRQNEEFEGFKNIVKERKKIRTDKMQKDVLWESKKMRKVLPGDMRCLW